MSVIGYCFSERGVMHIANDIPCQDYSCLAEYGMWHIAIVADGVGSCIHSDKASNIAVKAALRTIDNCFPQSGKEEDILSLLTMAFHCAANSVERYVKKNDGKFDDFHTTLAIALYDGKNLYYGNAGDSGIVALDEYGEYYIVTKKQNNEYDEVITLAARSFEIGKADYNVVALLCMTDGILDWVTAERTLKEANSPYPLYVPRANFLVRPEIWSYAEEINDEFTNALQEGVLKEIRKLTSDLDAANKDEKVIEELGNLDDGNLKDDLSIAMLINPHADMSADEIKWEAPVVVLSVDEMYLKKWREIVSLHPTTAKSEFRRFIQKYNPNFSEDEVDDYAEVIWNLMKSPEVTAKVESDVDSSIEEVDSQRGNPDQNFPKPKKERNPSSKKSPNRFADGAKRFVKKGYDFFTGVDEEQDFEDGEES